MTARDVLHQANAPEVDHEVPSSAELRLARIERSYLLGKLKAMVVTAERLENLERAVAERDARIAALRQEASLRREVPEATHRISPPSSDAAAPASERSRLGPDMIGRDDGAERASLRSAIGVLQQRLASRDARIRAPEGGVGAPGGVDPVARTDAGLREMRMDGHRQVGIIEGLRGALLKARVELAMSSRELLTARADIRRLEDRQAEFDRLAASLDAMRLSASWRLTAPLRRLLRALGPSGRQRLRRLAKLAYWCVTPHRTGARLAALRARAAQRSNVPSAADAPPSFLGAAGRRSAPSTSEMPTAEPGEAAGRETLPISLDPPASHESGPGMAMGGVALPRREPVAWFYVGDTLDWLDTHDRVTGVGRVTCELLVASLASPGDMRFVPCVEDPSALRGLSSVSHLETALYLSTRVGLRLEPGMFEHSGARAPRPVDFTSPQSGDHIVFTGVIWNRHYIDVFRRLRGDGVTFSVLIYDLIPIDEPEIVGEDYRAQFVEWLTCAVGLARILYVCSTHIKEQLIRWSVLAGVTIAAEIEVIRFGMGTVPRIATAAELRSAPTLAGVQLSHFVLSVGTIDKRKNQTFLCHAWLALLQELGADALPQLVLVGRDDLGLARLPEFAPLREADKLVVLEGLADADVFGLYGLCLFTAFPSLSEGYGLPVAESLHMGKLCVAADLPAIRAQAFDLPWYFDPRDQADAQAHLRRAVLRPEERVDAERRIASDAASVPWTSTLGQMASVVARAFDDETSSAPTLPNPREMPEYLAEVPLHLAMKQAQKWCTADHPEVSILIVNWNAGALTLECVRQIFANTAGVRYEIIIADNGSHASDLLALRPLSGIRGIRLLPLGCNRYFGEANNIAAEAATGHLLCLLNNDAFVRPGWLGALVEGLVETPEAGGVGPLFLFPDGSIQEAGGMMDAGGYPVRLGRNDDADHQSFLRPKFVDYISAAAFLLTRDDFIAVGGFDSMYEPAYYEDVDICFKLAALGKKILFRPDAVVVHIEGAAANHDAEAVARRNNLGDLNRGKFTSRWGAYLGSRKLDDAVRAAGLEALKHPPARSGESVRDRPRAWAAIYTPFDIIPGGGERYILSFAAALCADMDVTIVTLHPFSHLRLDVIAAEFGIDLSPCRLVTLKDFEAGPSPDVMVTMGNHIVPPVRLHGKRGIYLCQFPFRLPRSELEQAAPWLAGYNLMICYSRYAQASILTALSAFQLPSIPTRVVSPPTPQVSGDARDKRRIIVAVGRFFAGGHNKRHDLLIEAFRRLSQITAPPLELHLAGSSSPHPMHMDHLRDLKTMAEGLAVRFHINASRSKLEELYGDAMLYWHATGIDVDLETFPEKAEHFGISLVEAMSAQCVPLAFNAGGPREIITQGVDGYLYDSVDELVRLSDAILKDDMPLGRVAVAQKASETAALYAVSTFSENVRALVKACISAG